MKTVKIYFFVLMCMASIQNLLATNIVKNPSFELGPGMCGTGFNPCDPGNNTGPYYLENCWVDDWSAECSRTPSPHAHVYEDLSCFPAPIVGVVARTGKRFVDVAASYFGGVFQSDYRPIGKFTTGFIPAGNYDVSISFAGIGTSTMPNTEVEVILTVDGNCSVNQVIGTFTVTQSMAWQDFSANFNTVGNTYDRVEIRIKDMSSTLSSFSTFLHVDDVCIEAYTSFGCAQDDFWKVDGNTINGNNIFGTLSNDDIDIHTNNVSRGIITKSGEWGMGTPSPKARLHVESTTWGLGHIDASGAHPSLRLYQSKPGGGTQTVRLGLATSVSDFTHGSQPGDGILQNISRENSLIFGNGWNGNGVERVRIDEKGETGINMINSSSQYNPTAYLHVACQGNNGDDGNGLSDIRFEQLERGEGNVMLINGEGYVYDSGINLHDLSSNSDSGEHYLEGASSSDLKEELVKLTKKLELLKNKIEEMDSHTLDGFNEKSGGYQLYPNPTSGKFTVKHFIPNGSSNVFLLVTSVNGSEIMKLNVTGRGNCQSELRLPLNLNAGMYMCTLFIDDKVINAEKLILTK